MATYTNALDALYDEFTPADLTKYKVIGQDYNYALTNLPIGKKAVIYNWSSGNYDVEAVNHKGYTLFNDLQLYFVIPVTTPDPLNTIRGYVNTINAITYIDNPTGDGVRFAVTSVEVEATDNSKLAYIFRLDITTGSF